MSLRKETEDFEEELHKLGINVDVMAMVVFSGVLFTTAVGMLYLIICI